MAVDTQAPADTYFGSLQQLLDAVGGTKQANAEQTVLKDTSHPSKNNDDMSQPASEGAESAAQTKLVKELATGGGADGAAATAPSLEKVNDLTGVKATPTGEDTSVERDFGTHLKDPGTTQPVKVGDTTKSGSFMEKCANLDFFQLRDLYIKTANDLFASAVASMTKQPEPKPAAADTTKTAQAATPAEPAKTEPATPAATAATTTEKPAADAAATPTAAAGAGYNLAAQLGELGAEKIAAAREVIQNTRREAHVAADLVADHLEKMAKQAIQGTAKKADAMPPGAGMPSDAGAMSPPPTDMTAPAAPTAPTTPAAGPADPGMGAGGGAGGGGHEEMVEELLMAAMQAGITPEEIIEAASSMAGGDAGASGGAPPPSGGGDGSAPAGASEEEKSAAVLRSRLAAQTALTKLAADARLKFRSGSFDPSAVARKIAADPRRMKAVEESRRMLQDLRR